MSYGYSRHHASAVLGAVGVLLLGVSAGQPTSLAQAPGSEAAAGSRPLVIVAEVDAIIQPISAEYIIQTIDRADARDAELVVVVLRTPGGLVDSTRSIITSIIEADTPVAVFVGPSGARAASAGFYIVISADVAAMAPGSHIGAAHPVSGGGQQMDETTAEKAASDLAAYVRTLASARNRNVPLAEEAVLDSRSFTDEEALNAEPPLIDLVVADLEALLDELDGREVTRFDGSSVVLETSGRTVETIQMTWRQRILSGVAHPQVAYLLFTLGTLGLTIELWNPGAILPAVVGGLCLLLAFFAFQILPVSYAGVGLVLFGLLLLVLEAQTPALGLLALGGLVSLVFGSMMLIDSPLPEMQIGLRLILPLMLALGGIFLFLARLALAALRRRSVSGAAGMLDETGEVLTAIRLGETGRVSTHGEIWAATSTEAVEAGAAVRVTAVNGLTLTVAPAGSHVSAEGES